ncbi:hypothetical protein [Parendozoicomonas haliclonae]|nr:hypothetical protein [Parendozoicomonas haliclonae]
MNVFDKLLKKRPAPDDLEPIPVELKIHKREGHCWGRYVDEIPRLLRDDRSQINMLELQGLYHDRERQSDLILRKVKPGDALFYLKRREDVTIDEIVIVDRVQHPDAEDPTCRVALKRPGNSVADSLISYLFLEHPASGNTIWDDFPSLLRTIPTGVTITHDKYLERYIRSGILVGWITPEGRLEDGCLVCGVHRSCKNNLPEKVILQRPAGTLVETELAAITLVGPDALSLAAD